MKKAVLWMGLALVALLAHGAWAQDRGPYQNLKGKVLCFSIFYRLSTIINIDDPYVPSGLNKSALGQSLVERLKGRLQRMGVSLREILCANSDADVGLYFTILPVRRGTWVEGYAISSELVIWDWTTHPYPVRIWESGFLRVTFSRTAADLSKDLEEMTDEMASELILDWYRAQR